MRCCDVEKLWDDMRDALQPHREAVIKHLRACPPCQELYEQYEGIAYCLTCLPPRTRSMITQDLAPVADMRRPNPGKRESQYSTRPLLGGAILSTNNCVRLRFGMVPGSSGCYPTVTPG